MSVDEFGKREKIKTVCDDETCSAWLQCTLCPTARIQATDVHAVVFIRSAYFEAN